MNKCIVLIIVFLLCNYAVDAQQSVVDDLLAKMTIEEKIGQLNLITAGGNITGAVVSKNVNEKLKSGQVGGLFGIRGVEKVREAQKLAVEGHRLHIPLIIGSDVIHGHETIFPIPLALSCTWDMDLIQESARLAAQEATADGIMWNFSPMVDIARDPRWGRIAEGAGEDPFLGSAIARAMVRGYQGNALDDPGTMMACVKHFALYGAPEGGRDYATVDMSALRMHNEYLPPYKAAVEEGVGSVMTSFNVVDYIPASASHDLFTKILRDQWGFDGFVVTDYTAVEEMMYHGIGDMQEVSARSIQSGVDMDMVSEGFVSTLLKSYKEGSISEAEIDRACRRILEAKRQLGLLDDPYLYIDQEKSRQVMMSQEHRDFGRMSAAESFVLLKNDENTLPLERNQKIALIGPLADSRRNMLGTWSVSGDYKRAVTVLEAFQEVVTDTSLLKHAKGANISNDSFLVARTNAFGPEIVIDDRTPEEMIAEALKIAEQSDVVVAVVGESANMSGESSSLSNIELQHSQRKLLQALKSTGKPLVVILYAGRPMALSWEADHADAILHVWFGGTEGARAITDVLFGDKNPSGHLTTSFPVNTGQIPVYHSMLNTGRPFVGGTARAKFKSDYLDVPNEPLFPFGYGLSYTTFEYGPVIMSDSVLMASGRLVASVEVTNTGLHTGKDVVQMYIRDVVGSISRPVRELKGFEKIELVPGQTKTVSFEITPDLLKFYNKDLEYVNEPGEYVLFVGQDATTQNQATFTLK